VSRVRVMIVTASRHQRSLILKAKTMGYDVMATDSRVDAPALSFADRAAVVDAASREDLFRIAYEFQPHAIVSEQTDVAVPGVAYVAERLGLPGIGFETALRATDKWRMRAGVPAFRHRNIGWRHRPLAPWRPRAISGFLS
jgi:formate-dependent phosphoribosylglycinamide formyltransferase (GAR transformylase)